MKEKVKEFWASISKNEKISRFINWLKSDEGILLATLIFFPLGLFLIWKYSKYDQRIKIIASVAVAVLFISAVVTFNQKTIAESKLADLTDNHQVLATKHKKALSDLEYSQADFTATDLDYKEYKEKMKPYEVMEAADAKKKQADLAAADVVSSEIANLPEVVNLSLDEKGNVEKVRQHYNALTAEQKELVNELELKQREDRIPELEDEKKAAEEKAKAEKAAKEKAAAEEKAREEKEEAERKATEKREAEEEAKGYETGITYDQLARKPDENLAKKVKFSGKVIQVMEGDDSTQIRLAVNDDYDTVIYGEFESDIVKSRVLEDDYITIYGMSAGLMTYQATIGGKISIPGVLIDKIDQ